MTGAVRRSPAGIVHVVDDDASVRKALARLLGAVGYEAHLHASAAEYLMAPADEPGVPVCVVLDVRMPGPSGLDLHESLARRPVAPPVVFLTGHGSIPMSVRAMKSGAVDFLTKPVRRDAFLSAVSAALARSAHSSEDASTLREMRECLESLTPREREVFDGVVAGRLNKQIAADIGAAERTVKAYRANVMEKMKAESVADLARIAERLRKPSPLGDG